MSTRPNTPPETVPWAQYKRLRRGLVAAIVVSIALAAILTAVVVYYNPNEVQITGVNWAGSVKTYTPSNETSCQGPGLTPEEAVYTTGGTYPYGSRIAEELGVVNLNLSEPCYLSNLTVALFGPSVSGVSSNLPATVVAHEGAFVISVSFDLPNSAYDSSITISFEAAQPR